MAINEDQIRKLIKDYEGHREECLDAYASTGTAKAQVYGAVLNDLKALLPRQTLADVAGDNLEPYLGTWVSCGGQMSLIIGFTSCRVQIALPRLRECYWVDAVMVYPLDIRRVWDEDGDLVY